MTISLEEAYSGTRKRLEFEMEEPCPTCHGAGNVGGKPCATCHGSGWQRARREVDVKIPAGVRSGQKVRVSGEGGGSGAGRRGDLYLAVTVAPHPQLERRGDDLALTVPVTAPEAALGTSLEVPTLRGKVSMKVPPATSSTRRNSASFLRLRLATSSSVSFRTPSSAATSASSCAMARSAHPGPTFRKSIPARTRTRSFIPGDAAIVATVAMPLEHLVERRQGVVHHARDAAGLDRAHRFHCASPASYSVYWYGFCRICVCLERILLSSPRMSSAFCRSRSTTPRCWRPAAGSPTARSQACLWR